jgi:hypothetical protein
LKHFALMVALAALIGGVVAMPGSSASFNDGSPCPASGPLLVCPTMYVGQPVQMQLLAHDGCNVYRWEIVNGRLPLGLSMSSSGLVSGTPSTAESTQPWVWVHDLLPSEGGPSWCGGDNHSERQFVFTVVGGGGGGGNPSPPPPPQPALQITTSSLQKATVGTPYSVALTASGGSSLTWALTAGSLPAGVTLGSNGVLAGTPTAAGHSTFTVRVDGDGRSASKQLDLDVIEKLTASAPADQTWEVGRPLRVSIGAHGGTPGYSWSVSGTLPEHTGFVGNEGDGSTSYLQGVPGQAGTFPIVLTVTDSAGASAQVTVTLNVSPRLQIKTLDLGRAKVGKLYRLALASRGGVGDVSWTVSGGKLPSGLKLDPDAGVISGKPRVSGRFRFTVVAVDSLQAKAAMTYSLIIARR